MNSMFIYLYLEWKKSLRLVKKMVVAVSLLLVILTVGVAATTFAMTKANVMTKVLVGILVPESEIQTRIVVQFASTLDSVQSICEIVYYDEEELLMQDLRDGDIQAGIVFPDHFYEDADQGVNTPATVYVSDSPDLSQRLFRGMIRNGVGLLQTAESGVYAVLDLSEQYPAGLDREEIGDLLLDMYVRQLFNGGRLFEQIIASPFDSYRLPQYLFGGLLLLAVFLPGLCLGAFYRAEQRPLEQKLLILGIDAWKISLVRVVVMGQLLWFLFLGVYAAGCMFSAFSGYTIVFWDAEVLPGALFLCVALACVFHGIYACSGEVRTGTIVLLLVELWMLIGSGMLLPVDFLPELMQKLCRMTHLDAWSSFVLALIYQGFDGRSACVIGLYAVGMFGLGVLGLWKHTLSGYRFFLNNN